MATRKAKVPARKQKGPRPYGAPTQANGSSVAAAVIDPISGLELGNLLDTIAGSYTRSLAIVNPDANVDRPLVRSFTADLFTGKIDTTSLLKKREIAPSIPASQAQAGKMLALTLAQLVREQNKSVDPKDTVVTDLYNRALIPLQVIFTDGLVCARVEAALRNSGNFTEEIATLIANIEKSDVERRRDRIQALFESFEKDKTKLIQPTQAPVVLVTTGTKAKPEDNIAEKSTRQPNPSNGSSKRRKPNAAEREAKRIQRIAEQAEQKELLHLRLLKVQQAFDGLERNAREKLEESIHDIEPGIEKDFTYAFLTSTANDLIEDNDGKWYHMWSLSALEADIGDFRFAKKIVERVLKDLEPTEAIVRSLERLCDQCIVLQGILLTKIHASPELSWLAKKESNIRFEEIQDSIVGFNQLWENVFLNIHLPDLDSPTNIFLNDVPNSAFITSLLLEIPQIAVNHLISNPNHWIGAYVDTTRQQKLPTPENIKDRFVLWYKCKIIEFTPLTTGKPLSTSILAPEPIATGIKALPDDERSALLGSLDKIHTRMKPVVSEPITRNKF